MTNTELPLQLLKKTEGEVKKSIVQNCTFESYFKRTETHVDTFKKAKHPILYTFS